MCSPIWTARVVHSRALLDIARRHARREVLETDASKHFGTDAIGDAVYDLRTVVRMRPM
jgi:hypothetical protein